VTAEFTCEGAFDDTYGTRDFGAFQVHLRWEVPHPLNIVQELALHPAISSNVIPPTVPRNARLLIVKPPDDNSFAIKFRRDPNLVDENLILSPNRPTIWPLADTTPWYANSVTGEVSVLLIWL